MTLWTNNRRVGCACSNIELWIWNWIWIWMCLGMDTQSSYRKGLIDGWRQGGKHFRRGFVIDRCTYEAICVGFSNEAHALLSTKTHRFMHSRDASILKDSIKSEWLAVPVLDHFQYSFPARLRTSPTCLQIRLLSWWLLSSVHIIRQIYHPSGDLQ